MKAAFAAVLSGMQNLDHDDAHERPVDRLGALGAIQRRIGENARDGSELASLGVDLIAFKFGHRSASKTQAEEALASILGWDRWKVPYLEPYYRGVVAAWAIREWTVDFCPKCKGASGPDGRTEIPNDYAQPRDGIQPMRTCDECGGTGKRRYDDAERIVAMGDTYTHAMTKAHEIIARAESLAVERARDMLERR